MNAKKFSNALENINEKYVDEAITYEKKADGFLWIKCVSAAAACFCIVFIGAFLFQYFGNKQFEIPQKVIFNDNEYIVCGSRGEATILANANLPSNITEQHAGKRITYLSVKNNIFTFCDQKTEYELYEYAPFPNDNVYIILIDGEYYAAIRHNSDGYHGIED